MKINETTTIILNSFEDAIAVDIGKDVYDICNKFAESVNPTTKYNDCGQNDMSKRLLDNLIGKIGEFSVFGILRMIGKEKGFSINYPDVNVYKGKQKNWKSDLAIPCDDGDINIAVKSQSLSQALKYSFSGTFQTASFRKDKVFDNKDELIFLCLIDDVVGDYKKSLVLPPKTIDDIKFSDPKLPKFKGIKTCYYAKDNFHHDHLHTWLSKFGANNIDKIIQ